MAEYHYALSGDVDLATADGVRSDLRNIIARCDSHVLVDCSQLTFIDSMGISVLVDAHGVLAADGRDLFIANVPAQCQKVFNTLGLEYLLRDDRELSP